MHNSITSAVLLGAAAVSAVPAAWGPMNRWGSHPSSTVSSSSAGQTPFSFPLANGFPNVSDATLHDIEEQAHGTLPNGALPTELNATSAVVLELIAFNEAFEVAFFTSLIQNITDNIEGFQIDSQVLRNFVLETLIIVQGQEELHFLGANGILGSAKETQIQPCEYVFPTADFDSAINLARTFTDVVLGTLQDAQNTFATDGDSELVALIGSVIGQEGEQNGYYRELLGRNPSSNPFLTRSAGQFAFSVLNQDFVVPGSCPPVDNVLFDAIPILGALTVDTENIQAKDQTLTFTVESNSTDFAGYSLVLVNQQNLPVVEKITNVTSSNGCITFEAFFPGADLIMDGLTIAAVTKSAGPFTSVPDVAADSLFGPGLIEVN